MPKATSKVKRKPEKKKRGRHNDKKDWAKLRSGYNDPPPTGRKPGHQPDSPEEKSARQIEIAMLLGANLDQREIARRVGVNRKVVAYVKKRMALDSRRAEVLRLAAEEARRMVGAKAMNVLNLAIDKLKAQITGGVKTKDGKFEAPMAHVAQAVRSLGDIAIDRRTPEEKPDTPSSGMNRVALSPKQMADMLMQVRDHEQARSTKIIDVTPVSQGAGQSLVPANPEPVAQKEQHT